MAREPWKIMFGRNSPNFIATPGRGKDLDSPNLGRYNYRPRVTRWYTQVIPAKPVVKPKAKLPATDVGPPPKVAPKPPKAVPKPEVKPEFPVPEFPRSTKVDPALRGLFLPPGA
jgi:hypothetical protein